MNRAIPFLDLGDFIHGDQSLRNQFVKELGHAFRHIGFVGIVNHGIPRDMVKAFYAQAKQFFSLPVEVKRKYEVPGLAGQRGYTSFGKEHAKQSRVADLKEFYQIGQEVDDSDPIKSEYPDNVMTQDCSEFTKIGNQLYRSFERSGAYLLQAIALDLGLDVDYFEAKIHHGNSILRAIHYPPIIQEPDSAIRSEQHEDINLITLLVGASAGGLQVLTKDNQWLDVVTAEDEIVVNVGDMLQRLTNNVLKSTTHRVVNPPKESWHVPRLSIPFFLHPRSTMDLSCLEHCITKDHPKQYEPITAGEYLSERLMEIGLKK
ncbi:MAG: isopenicillin N synthase family oxygenase [Saprospiraceae bacterium]|jgi:isopenicillin N synthase-like dioxygenase|nr:isopenicillin N synthase family oxygenase [Saprospiraceae bacterium]MCI1267339.1 isopenicillin N synthase family oxygenase [Saprospiraceae bacterium]